MTAFPLSVSADGRHLVGADGRMFLITGDTAWSLIASLTPDEIVEYLEHRAALGFNTIVVNVLEALFAPNAPATIDGIAPFHTPGDLSTPNDAYFDRMTWAFEQAAARDILVLACAAYLGYANPNFPGYGERAEGWFASMAQATVDQAHAYGRYVGGRLAHLDNIAWILLGDCNPGVVIEQVRALAAGLLDARPDRLAMAHPAPDSKGLDFFEGEAWLTLNSTYSYLLVHRSLLADYARAELPTFLFETTYEGEWNSTPLQVRRQAYWAVTLGGIGHTFGQWPVWPFREGWRAALDSPGSHAMAHFRRFFESFEWWRTAPVADGLFVGGEHFLVEGLGEMHGMDYASTGASESGDLIVTYVPTARRIRPDLARFGGGTWSAVTFDPVSGEFGDAFDVADGDAIEPATDHDWAVVLTRSRS